MTSAELNELVTLAQAGDREAANAVARQVMPWVRWKAKVYANQFRVEQEELVSVGLAKLAPSVAKYRRDSGGFLNYFAFAASRAMTASIRSGQRWRDSVQYDLECVPDDEPPESEDDGDVLAALARLDPVSRDLVEGYYGYDGTRRVLPVLAARLGLTNRRARRILNDAVERLRCELV